MFHFAILSNWVSFHPFSAISIKLNLKKIGECSIYSEFQHQNTYYFFFFCALLSDLRTLNFPLSFFTRSNIIFSTLPECTEGSHFLNEKQKPMNPSSIHNKRKFSPSLFFAKSCWLPDLAAHSLLPFFVIFFFGLVSFSRLFFIRRTSTLFNRSLSHDFLLASQKSGRGLLCSRFFQFQFLLGKIKRKREGRSVLLDKHHWLILHDWFQFQGSHLKKKRKNPPKTKAWRSRRKL